MADLGFVGLGTMGGRMARRLLDAGHHVTGYNRTRARAQWLVDMGMEMADTPRAVADVSEVTFSMMANDDALLAVTEGDDGVLAGLAPGKVYVDMSTVSPQVSRELAARTAERGAVMLDAPVSGSAVTVEAGTLSFMVGGDAATLERVTPYLKDIGPTITHVGGNGQAAAMKIAINLSLPVQVLAFCEGLLLAERSGIPRDVALEAMVNSVAASPMLKYRAPLIGDTTKEALFDVTMIQKDLELALEMGHELGVPLNTAAVTNQMLTTARGMGLGNKDFIIFHEMLRRLSGEAPE
jgi:3-hydroxyisobutyrate dehydrogenase-like beta-hydroxyacid dehydrogenase